MTAHVNSIRKNLVLIAVILTLIIGWSVGGWLVINARVNDSARSACQALELLTRTPIQKPDNPSANPSRETTYQFYVALVYWKDRTC